MIMLSSGVTTAFRFCSRSKLLSVTYSNNDEHPQTDTIFIAGWCWTVAIGAKRQTSIAAEFGRESFVLDYFLRLYGFLNHVFLSFNYETAEKKIIQRPLHYCKLVETQLHMDRKPKY